MKPIPRPAILDAYEGQWVVLSESNDEVLFHASTSTELAAFVLTDPCATTGIVQYVFPPSDSWRVGAG